MRPLVRASQTHPTLRMWLALMFFLRSVVVPQGARSMATLKESEYTHRPAPTWTQCCSARRTHLARSGNARHLTGCRVAICRRLHCMPCPDP